MPTYLEKVKVRVLVRGILISKGWTGKCVRDLRTYIL